MDGTIYHPFTPCAAQVPLTVGISWTIAKPEFAVRVVTWDDSSAIVFVKIATNVLLDCVSVTRFASAMLCSCCISANNAAFA